MFGLILMSGNHKFIFLLFFKAVNYEDEIFKTINVHLDVELQ